MRVTRITIVVAVVSYVVLWAIALNGASNFIAPLLIPLVLAVMIALGVAFNRWMGISPRRQHFNDVDDDAEDEDDERAP